MHTLVFGLFHERADPALIIDHAAQAREVRDRCTDHPRHCCHRFQNNGAMTVAFGKKGVCAKPEHFREAQRKPI